MANSRYPLLLQDALTKGSYLYHDTEQHRVYRRVGVVSRQGSQALVCISRTCRATARMVRRADGCWVIEKANAHADRACEAETEKEVELVRQRVRQQGQHVVKRTYEGKRRSRPSVARNIQAGTSTWTESNLPSTWKKASLRHHILARKVDPAFLDEFDRLKAELKRVSREIRRRQRTRARRNKPDKKYRPSGDDRHIKGRKGSKGRTSLAVALSDPGVSTSTRAADELLLCSACQRPLLCSACQRHLDDKVATWLAELAMSKRLRLKENESKPLAAADSNAQNVDA